MTALLDVRDLRVEFQTSEGVGSALNGVDLSVKEGQILGIVGESGSGKVGRCDGARQSRRTPRAGLSPGPSNIGASDLLRESERALQKIRGREIGLVVQNAKSALNPLVTIGRQLVNVIRGHGMRDKRARRTRRAHASQGRHS